MPEVRKSLWEVLWDYDPNGLLVVDRDLRIRVVNPALCQLLKTEAEELIGARADAFLDDVDDLRAVWETGDVIRGREKRYDRYDLVVREVVFPVPDENIVACIMVDLTHEARQNAEMGRLKRETLDNVTRVVERQMHVAQEIAGLLGETAAETQVSLLNLARMLSEESAQGG